MVFTFALGAGALNVNSPISYADGANSPTECKGNPNDNPNADNVKSSQQGTDDLVVVDVGAGNVVDGVCIKAGNPHTGPLGNGTFDIDGNPGTCYQVTGVGTQVVTVERVGSPSPDCQEISHIDVLFSKAQEPEQPEEPETPTVPETPGDVGGGLQELKAPAEAPQAQAPEAGVAAGGAISSVVAYLVALGGSVASMGYGLLRLRNFGA
jgi:hypothetical protein